MNPSEQERQDPDSGQGLMATVLTPGAMAITAFTLAVLTASGQNGLSVAAQSFFGTTYALGDYQWIVAIGAVASAAVAFGAILLAWRVITQSAVSEVTWELHLARAAIIIGGFGGLCAGLALIGSIVGGLS